MNNPPEMPPPYPAAPRDPRGLTAIGAAIVVGLCVCHARAEAADTWTHAASTHFEVYTTGHAARAREILVYFERVHAFFADFLEFEPKARRPTRLVVFSNAREYRPYQLNEFATAYYMPGPDGDCIVMRSFDAESYPIVVHEYAHLMARYSNAAYPPWLDEGLAEFFSTLAPEAGEMRLGLVPIGRLRELRTSGAMLDLDRLLAVTHASREYSTRDHAGIFYAQSWALTHMLLASEAYQRKSGAFLAQAATGTPAAAALSAVYGKTTAEVFRDLQAYVQGDRFAYFRRQYREPTIPAVYPTRQPTRFEAGLVTANLLARRPDRVVEVRAVYERLAQERPDDRDLLEARGLFEVRHGDRHAAHAFLTRAIAAKSENAEIYRWAASMAKSAVEQETLLRAALALTPDAVDVRLAYAAALKLRGEARAAREALSPVTRVEPNQAFMFFELQASIGLQLAELDAARIAAVKARQYARSLAESSHVERLIQAIDERAAYVAGKTNDFK